MNDFNIKMNVEPTDNYTKAKKDLLQAMISVQALTPVEQRRLAEEIFGAAKVTMVLNLLQNFVG